MCHIALGQEQHTRDGFETGSGKLTSPSSLPVYFSFCLFFCLFLINIIKEKWIPCIPKTHGFMCIVVLVKVKIFSVREQFQFRTLWSVKEIKCIIATLISGNFFCYTDIHLLDDFEFTMQFILCNKRESIDWCQVMTGDDWRLTTWKCAITDNYTKRVWQIVVDRNHLSGD